MARTFLMLLFMFLCTVSVGMAQSTNQDKKLIRVTPSYSEASYVPEKARHPNSPPPPTPREQMYVFWVLGKILSYPLDTAESYISTWLNRRQNAPLATPASAGAAPNPFSTMNEREIPPAPPALARPE